MISAEYCRAMARYNQWQNNGLRTALQTLSWTAITTDRGAFFGSIFGTANHLLWGDTIWMSRFDGGPKPSKPSSEHKTYCETVQVFDATRSEVDARIIAWADQLEDDRLSGDISWSSGGAGQNATMSKAQCVVGFFNHQTHHRGQIHAMLTAAGYRPNDTDFILMPGTLGEDL